MYLFFLFIFRKCLFFWFHCTWDLSSYPRIEPMPLAFEAQSLNHWTSKEAPPMYLFELWFSQIDAQELECRIIW